MIKISKLYFNAKLCKQEQIRAHVSYWQKIFAIISWFHFVILPGAGPLKVLSRLAKHLSQKTQMSPALQTSRVNFDDPSGDAAQSLPAFAVILFLFVIAVTLNVILETVALKAALTLASIHGSSQNSPRLRPHHAYV